MANVRALQGLQGTVGQPTAQVIDGSLSFKPTGNGSGSERLNRTPSSSGNRRTWTWSAWVKRGNRYSGTNETHLLDSRVNDDDRFYGIAFTGPNDGEFLFVWEEYSAGNYYYHKSTPSLRDNGWYHLVVTVDTTQPNGIDRVKFYANGKLLPVAAEDGTYGWYAQNFETNVNQASSTHFIGSLNGARNFDGYLCQNYLIDGLALGPGYFGFTDPLTNTWRPKKFRAVGTTVNDGTVWSSGIPGNTLSGYAATNGFDGSTSTFVYANVNTTMTWTAPKKITGELIEVYAYAGNTHPILKVNGKSTGAIVGGISQQNVWVDVTDLCGGPGGVLETIQAFGENIGGVDRQSGFSAVRVDGVILTDSTTTNLDFGTNGFYLPMDNEDDFEKDKSGKGNDFTTTNFSGTSVNPDVVKDSPSGAVFGGRGQTGITTTSSAPSNYPTLNPLNNINCTLSEGNLKFVTGGNNSTIWSTMPIPTSGKYCFESTFGGGDMALWLDQEARRENRNTHLTSTALGMFMYYNTGDSNNRFQTNSVSTAMDSSFTTDTVGDVFMFEVDMDAGTVRVRKDDGSDSGLYTMPDALKAAPLFIGFSVTTTWPAVTQTLNFGQRPFKNTPSQGFLPLNSATVRPNKVVPRPDQYVGVTTYSGDNSEYRLLSLNHQPDFTWFKERGNIRSHILSDTVTGITKHLSTDGTDAQTSPSYPYVSSVDERGIVLRGGTSSGGNVSGRYYVAWSWKAGGNKSTFNVDDKGYASAAAAGLDGGSVNPTGASVGTEQGFSIITWTPTPSTNITVSHGLGKTPKFMILRQAEGSAWSIYHEAVGATKRLRFASAAAATSTIFGDTAPTDTVFTSNITSLSNRTGIGYLWADVPGLQKFGSYTGNASTDGTYVELGFRPSVIMIKSSSNSVDWVIFDVERGLYNPISNTLYPNLNDAEYGVNVMIDVLSNGFKLRNTYTNINASSYDYIYAAWAAAPASNLFGGQSNAR